MRHDRLAIEVGEVHIGVVHVTVRRDAVATVSKAFLVQLAIDAIHVLHREVPLDVEARVGAARPGPTLGVLLGGLSRLYDVQKNGLQVPLILSLLIDHSLLLRIDLQLDAIDLPFCILAVNLVVHAEERQDRQHIGEHEVKTLPQFEETRIVARKLQKLHILGRDGCLEERAEQVRRSEEYHEDLEAFLLRLHRTGAFYVHDLVLLAQVVHNAHQEVDGGVEQHCIDQKEDSHFEENRLHAQKAIRC